MLLILYSHAFKDFNGYLNFNSFKVFSVQEIARFRYPFVRLSCVDCFFRFDIESCCTKEKYNWVTLSDLKKCHTLLPRFNLRWAWSEQEKIPRAGWNKFSGRLFHNIFFKSPLSKSLATTSWTILQAIVFGTGCVWEKSHISEF